MGRHRNLAGLSRAIIRCARCPRLRAHCSRVARETPPRFRGQTYWARPVPGYGDPHARLLVVGLAPAAHGANRTGRVFTGDSSGNWLYAALYRHRFANQPESTGRPDGLALTDCYVTAAARCAPPANRPTSQELANCRAHLEAEMALLKNVKVVVALGRVAHESWLRAAGWWGTLTPRMRPRFGHGVEARMPDGRILLTSFHPSRQNTQTGRLTLTMWDAIFRRCRRLLERG